LTSAFPKTKLSAIQASRSEDPAERRDAFEAIIAAYWKPVYKYVRMRWNRSSEDAQDLTQGFFTDVLAKHFFDRYDPAKARFRTFLRTCLDAFIANQDKAAKRIKRGGDARVLSVDFASAERGLDSLVFTTTESPDHFFHQEWVRTLFELAVQELQESCNTKGKAIYFKIFERYDLESVEDEDRITYDQLAAEFGITVTQVTNYLASARREFRRLILDKLRRITTTVEEFRYEARALLGIDLR